MLSAVQCTGDNGETHRQSRLSIDTSSDILLLSRQRMGGGAGAIAPGSWSSQGTLTQLQQGAQNLSRRVGIDEDFD